MNNDPISQLLTQDEPPGANILAPAQVDIPEADSSCLREAEADDREGMPAERRRPVTDRRHEIKMTVTRDYQSRVESWIRLHWAGFRRAYPDRQINNVYFDTPALDSFLENTGGVSRRRKLRLRWYGREMDRVSAIVELKCKEDWESWKICHTLSRSLRLRDISWSTILRDVPPQLPPSLASELRLRCCPVLLNRYRRDYYVSAEGRIRATLDSAYSCYDQRGSIRPNLDHPHPNPDFLILEFKAAVSERDRLAEVVSGFPFRAGKHSKYQSSLEALLGCDG